MELRDAIYQRRSTRSFTDRTVTRAEIETMLDAAIHAPSACNMQSWHFYVVTDPKVKEGFDGICAPWARTAPVMFVVCTDGEAITSRFGERARLFTYQDTSLAIENLLLTATELGLGGCFMGAFDAGKVRELLAIPEKYEIIALVPVGEPATEVAARERKAISEVAKFI